MLGIIAADYQLWPLAPLLVLLAFGAVMLWRAPHTLGCCVFAAAAFYALHLMRHHESAASDLLEELGGQRQVVRATGIVSNEPEIPQMWSRRTTCRFHLKIEAIELGGIERELDAKMLVHWAAEPPRYGDRVSLLGSAQKLAPPRNPGEFDSANYLRRAGVHAELRTRYPGDCRILSRGHGRVSESFAIRARAWVKQQLAVDLEDAPEVIGLTQSVLLGLKKETPEDVRELFKRTGTMHLFAVSGLHAAMLGGIAWMILKIAQVPRPAAALAIIAVLFGYALLTGWSPSCVRAAIMGSLVVAALVVDRPPIVYNSLGAAALAILAWDTNQLFAPGFQFSFVLVFVIVLLAARLQQRIEPLGRPDPFLPPSLWSRRQKAIEIMWGRLAATFGVTAAAWLGSLFFTAAYFHLFSPSAVLANLIAVPLAFCVLAVGVLAVLSAAVSTLLVTICNNANYFFTYTLLRVVEAFAALPGSYYYVELPQPGPPPQCEFTVFDLEGGGAIHLRAGGRDWLIDCGSTARYERVVLPYLRTRGVNRLDGLWLTHGDAQHIGGAPGVLQDLRPRQIIDSPIKDRSATRRTLHAQLAAKQRGKAILFRGDQLRAGSGATIRVLYPPAALRRPIADDKAFVLMLEADGQRALFMSDSGFATEEWLVRNEPDLRADLIVKGQHASDLSGTGNFLARAQPQAIICSGPGFGAPAAKLDEWEAGAAARGIAVFRQDRTGAVQVKLRDGAWELRGFLDDQTFRSRAR